MPRDEDDQRQAVVYLRQSEDRDNDELAVTRQREDADKFAGQRRFNVVAVYVDNDTSAKGQAPRADFDATLAAIEAGRASVIIARDMDRLTRNARDRLRLIETGRKHNTLLALWRASDIDLGTPAGRLTADILASVAQNEIEVKSDRQKRANLQAARLGRRVGGRRPFGYEDDGRTLRMDEADAVRDAYTAYLSGTNLTAIARDWNARGFAAQKAPWCGTTVRQVLANPRYMGWRGYAPTQEGKRGRPKQEPVAKAEWPPIVSENLWHGVDAMLQTKATSAAGRGARMLLTGVALCGVCVEEGIDATVHGGGSVHKYLMYRCSRTYGHIGRKAEPVDDWVSAYAVARLQRDDARELLSIKPSADLADLRTEHESLVQRKKKFADELRGEISPSDYRVMINRFNEQLAEIDAKMADDGRNAILGPLIGADDVEAIWEATPRDRQRRVIGALFTVTLLRSRIGLREFDPDSVIVEPRRELRPVPPLPGGIKKPVGQKKDRRGSK